MARREIANVGVAVLAASLAPALTFSAIGGALPLLTLAFVVALAHATVLGLPLYLLLRRKNWLNAVSTAIAGFLIGAIPVAVLTWPLRYPDLKTNAWIGPDGVQTMVDGVPTLAGWLQFLQGSLFFGAFGLLGGLAFWATLRLAAQLPSRASASTESALAGSSGPKPLSRAVLVAVPILAVAAVAIPVITKDRSCHNVLRDGRSSISPVAVFDLEIDDDEWPELTNVLRTFGKSHQMSFRDSSKVTPDVVRTLYLSTCTEDVNVKVAEQRWAHNSYKNLLGDRGVSMVVYVQRKESNWPRLVKPLVATLETRWSGKLLFRGPEGQVVPKPTELTANSK